MNAHTISGLVAGSGPSHEEVLERFYQRHEWFNLRDAVCKPSSNVAMEFFSDIRYWFYRGAVACVFNRLRECRKCFQHVLELSPQLRQAYRAHELLSWMHLRRSDFQQVLRQHDKMLAFRPGNQALLAGWELFAVLSQYPRQRVSMRGASTHEYTMHQGNMFIPAKVNGKIFNFMLDSGASISFMTESAARELDLTFHEVGPNALKMFGATGEQTRFCVALARRLVIGSLEIFNVPFLVLKNEQFGFTPPYSAALGLSVLLGLGSLSWGADMKLLIGLRPRTEKLPPNLCFDEANLVTEVRYQHRKFLMLLDTGNARSILWPPFARELPDALSQTGPRGLSHLEGITGIADIGNLSLEEIKLEVGGFVATLSPADVLLTTTTPNSNWLSGWLGIDLFNQAHRISLDFYNMRLTLE